MRVRLLAVLGAFHAASARALAVATGLGLLLDLVRPGSAVHPHWMGSVGHAGLDALLAAAFVALEVFGRPTAARRPALVLGLRRGVGIVLLALVSRALRSHLAALASGGLAASGSWPPVTVLALLVLVPWTLRRPLPVAPRGARWTGFAGVSASCVALAALLMGAVASTDYRAPADAIVVLGARVHADGTPSGVLADRTDTAIALWREGLAPVLVLSGGRASDAPLSEPEAMRRRALAAGVPESALLLDESGTDSAATMAFAASTAKARGWKRVLVVSQDYHLARLRLLAAREGLPVRTVPARETCSWPGKPLAVGREVAAYLACWLLPSRG